MFSAELIVRLSVAKQEALSMGLGLAQVRAKIADAIADAVPKFCYRHVSEPSGWVGNNEQEHCGEHFVVVKWEDQRNAVMSQELVSKLFATNLLIHVARSFRCTIGGKDTLKNRGIYLQVFQKVEIISVLQNQTA